MDNSGTLAVFAGGGSAHHRHVAGNRRAPAEMVVCQRVHPRKLLDHHPLAVGASVVYVRRMIVIAHQRPVSRNRDSVTEFARDAVFRKLLGQRPGPVGTPLVHVSRIPVRPHYGPRAGNRNAPAEVAIVRRNKFLDLGPAARRILLVYVDGGRFAPGTARSSYRPFARNRHAPAQVVAVYGVARRYFLNPGRTLVRRYRGAGGRPFGFFAADRSPCRAPGGRFFAAFLGAVPGSRRLRFGFRPFFVNPGRGTNRTSLGEIIYKYPAVYSLMVFSPLVGPRQQTPTETRNYPVA